MRSFPRRLRVITKLAAMTVAALSLSLPLAAASGTGVPFTDANDRGSLTFCNRAGQPVTSGSLDSVPFAWKTVSSAPAPKGYRNSISTATLYVYQPIKYVDPGDWSGTQLTGSSTYSNPAHPVAQATNNDVALLGFTNAYPSHWDHLVEVRMYFSSYKLGQYATHYPAAVLKVTGGTWTLVQGGGSSCSAGKGVSDETKLLSPKRLKHPHDAVPFGSPTPSAALPSSHAGESSSPATAAGSSSPRTTHIKDVAGVEPLGGSSSGTSTGAKVGIGLGVVAVLAVLAGAFAWWRRQPAGRS